ncbi:PD-(D/E)XK nuclease family protein [Rhizobium laguerreae]|uniref:PD-(D/E)XK nuclease family protein n=1 Tax=Rhizobium laguerreae TaxID=1076926 RepID=UPI001C91843B|nr:PD-(D/E)XK nuclease family protein [Rhizobium laguerreae]MBY3211487.1 PD-(D/E)XK nuclease family protein [Rhizobium laguerreae]
MTVALKKNTITELAQRLERFFLQQKPLLQQQKFATVSVEPERLFRLLAELSPLIAESASIGDAADIWSVVGLDRNEVRTARILTWLLDPRGSHGFRGAILSALWQQFPVEQRPFNLGLPLRSRREIIPLGDAQNRVDIEIEGDDFLLIIEVKIGAVEQPDQLNRYMEAAKKKAAARNLARHGVLYLTPARATTVPEGCRQVTWLDVARAIETAASGRPAGATGTQLALAFATHVREL